MPVGSTAAALCGAGHTTSVASTQQNAAKRTLVMVPELKLESNRTYGKAHVPLCEVLARECFLTAERTGMSSEVLLDLGHLASLRVRSLLGEPDSVGHTDELG